MSFFKPSDCDINSDMLSLGQANELIEKQRHEEQEFLRDLISVNEHLQDGRLKLAFMELKEKARKLIK